MKILLTVPICYYHEKIPKNTYLPPLGVLYLAAVLRDKGYDVQFIDFYSDKLWNKKEQIIKSSGADVIGVTAMTTSFREARDLIKIAKETGATVLIGGAHSTSAPLNSLQYTDADIAFFGEAEESIVDVIRCIEKNKDLKDVRGIFYRKNGRIIANEAAEPIKDSDSIPLPARDLLEDVYTPFIDHVGIGGNIDANPFLASRGCAYSCTFCCVKPFGCWRGRTPSKVVDEIEQVTQKTGKKGVYFYDLCFTLNEKWVTELCDEIVKRKLDILWDCNARASNLTESMIKTIKKAGCLRLSIGIESVSQASLDAINKQTTVAQIENAVKLAHDNEITALGFMMIGLPKQTPQAIEKEAKLLELWVKKYNLYISGFGPTLVFPGTKLYEQYGNFSINWIDKINPGTIYPNIPYYDKEMPKELILKYSEKLGNKFREMLTEQTNITYKRVTTYRMADEL